jgi:hypothetical protein
MFWMSDLVERTPQELQLHPSQEPAQFVQAEQELEQVSSYTEGSRLW